MSGFAFEENKFFKNTSIVSNVVGSYCKDLKWYDGNVVRRNTYQYVKFGNVADKTNALSGDIRGLHYLCNTNISVSGADMALVTGAQIRRDQGVILNTTPATFGAAGNKFSSVGVGLSIQNLGQNFRYHRIPGITIEDPTTNGNVLILNAAISNQCAQTYCGDEPCPELPAPQTPLMLKSDYFTKRSEYNSAKLAYNTAVGNGNTAQAEQKMIEMAGARNVMDHNALLIVDGVLNDTIDFNEDTLLTWFALMENPAAHLQLARHYMAKGYPTQANATLAQATGLFNLVGDDATDFSNLANIVNLIGTQSVYNLKAQTLTALDSYANGSDGMESTLLAQNIKSMYGSYYPPKYEMPSTGERSSDTVQEPVFSKNKAIDLTVSPNPTKGNVLFKLSDKTEHTQTITLTVVDMNNNPIWQGQIIGDTSIIIWDASKVANGVYAYKVNSDDGSISLSGKIVVLK
jgi:hypothetical protein